MFLNTFNLGHALPLVGTRISCCARRRAQFARVSPTATAMLPAVVNRLLIAFANPAANCGSYILRPSAASMLRVMLRWMIQA